MLADLPHSYPDTLRHPTLNTALEGARNARSIIKRYFEQGVTMRCKAPNELVSDADVEAERAIVQVIRRDFPDHAILAEEGFSQTEQHDQLWIIDPLDGTNNFAHHIPHFAVSIAYYHQGQAQVAVITNPMNDDWYLAVRGQGAWYNGTRCHVSSATQLDQTMVGVGFYYDRGAMMEATLAAIADFFRENIQGIRRFGTAALDMGFLGRGLFGAYFEYMLSPWDFAAGKLFVEEAGGTVTNCQGAPLPVAAKSTILASNGILHPASLAITKKHWKS
jgi:myo-inositol-1(or 4)-monophosphatase